MEGKVVMGCRRLGRGAVRRMEGRSLPAGDIPTQWMLAASEGDEERRNITYVTTEARSPVVTQSLVGVMCGLHVNTAI